MNLTYREFTKGEIIMRRKILFLGGEDVGCCLRLFAKIAKADGEMFKIGVLVCDNDSLENFAINIRTGEEKFDFLYFEEGRHREVTYENFSVQRAVKWDDWDIFAIGQKVGLSGIEESYEPFLKDIVGFVREHLPGAAFVLTEPHSFDEKFKGVKFAKYGYSSENMRRSVKKAVESRIKADNIDYILPIGEAWSRLKKAETHKNIKSDDEHGGREGNYLFGALAYEMITGRDINKNLYRLPFVKKEEAEILKNIIHSTALEYLKK